MNNSLTFEVQKKVALDTIQILTMAAGLVSACSIAGAKTAVEVSGGALTKEGAAIGASIGLAATAIVVWVYRTDTRKKISQVPSHISPLRFPIQN